MLHLKYRTRPSLISIVYIIAITTYLPFAKHTEAKTQPAVHTLNIPWTCFPYLLWALTTYTSAVKEAQVSVIQELCTPSRPSPDPQSVHFCFNSVLWIINVKGWNLRSLTMAASLVDFLPMTSPSFLCVVCFLSWRPTCRWHSRAYVHDLQHRNRLKTVLHLNPFHTMNGKSWPSTPTLLPRLQNDAESLRNR